MKKVKSSLLVAIALVVAFFVLTPRWAVNGLGEALESRDTVEIEERVDFERLREGLKGQVQAIVAGETYDESASDDPFAALGTGLAMMLADGLIDAFVTPAALSSMSRGLSPSRRSSSDTGPFEDASISRESLDRFSATVSDGESEIRWVFHRDGLRWRLTNIVLDEELLTSSLP